MNRYKYIANIPKAIKKKKPKPRKTKVPQVFVNRGGNMRQCYINNLGHYKCGGCKGRGNLGREPKNWKVCRVCGAVVQFSPFSPSQI